MPRHSIYTNFPPKDKREKEGNESDIALLNQCSMSLCRVYRFNQRRIPWVSYPFAKIQIQHLAHDVKILLLFTDLISPS